MKEDKLAPFFFTPFSESFKEDFARDFLVIDISTKLRGDVKNIITTIFQLREKISVTENVTEHLGRWHSNQHFSSVSFIEIVDHILHSVRVNEMRILLVNLMISLKRDNSGAENVSAVDQLRCGDILNNRTENFLIIHTTIVLVTDTRRCSEEILTICNHAHCSNSNKEMLSASIVCLIKIYRTDVDATINNLRKTVIGGEDNAGLICCPRSIVEECNLIGIGRLKEARFTTVSVANMHPGGRNMLHELLTQLRCKKDARSNNNDGAIAVSKQLLNVLDHNNSFATASGYNYLTMISVLHCSESASLVRAKRDHRASLRVVGKIITPTDHRIRGGVCRLCDWHSHHLGYLYLAQISS